MIFRNRKPQRPTSQVSPVELLNDLMIALRDVIDCEDTLAGFAGGRKPEGATYERARAAVQRVCNLHRMLEKQSDDWSKPLTELSTHTGLDMNQLLSDCLEFPEVIPYVRNLSGLRRKLICYCGKREAVDRDGLRLCKECLYAALDCVREKRKYQGFVLYRAYSPEVPAGTLILILYLSLSIKKDNGPPPGAKCASSMKNNEFAN